MGGALRAPQAATSPETLDWLPLMQVLQAGLIALLHAMASITFNAPTRQFLVLYQSCWHPALLCLPAVFV